VFYRLKKGENPSPDRSRVIELDRRLKTTSKRTGLHRSQGAPVTNSLTRLVDRILGVERHSGWGGGALLSTLTVEMPAGGAVVAVSPG